MPVPGYPLLDHVPGEYKPKVLTSRFPLFCIRSERLLPETLDAVWSYVAWSCNIMLQGNYPAAGFDEASGSSYCRLGNHRPGEPMYGGRRFKLCEIRGDWKQHVLGFKLTHYYNCNGVCHCCRASKVDPSLAYTDFRKDASWKQTIRTHREFLLEELGEPFNGLAFVKEFHYSMIRFDSMHTVNLGCGLFTNGGAFFELFKLNWFPGEDEPAQWRAAHASFRTFTRLHKVECSQPVFKPWMLITRGEEYCWFASKASDRQGSFGSILFGYRTVYDTN